MGGVTWTPLDGKLPKHGTRDGPYRYDATLADAAVAWYPKYLRLPDAARRFSFEPWQEFYIRALDGWVTSGRSVSRAGMPILRGRSRHRYHGGHIEIARGNGKSTFGAGRGVKGLIGDGRLSPFVLGAGTDVDNAGIIFRAAAAMVRADPRLMRRLRIIDSRRRIIRRHAEGFYRIIGAEAKHAHGYHPSLIIIDDLQAQPSEEFIRVLRSSQVTIDDPLMLAFLTAGYDESTIAWEEHVHAKRVLEDPSLDEGLLAMIFAASADDDFEDPATWLKANPNLGVTVSEDFIRGKVREMTERPARRNEILRLHFNVWTEGEFAPWIPADIWSRVGGSAAPDLAKRRCFVGIMAASAIDVAAVVYVFPPERGDGYRVVMEGFVPEDQLARLEARDNITYRQWIADGWLTTTPGDVRDDATIAASIAKHAKTDWSMEAIACNPRGAANLMTLLTGKGLDVVGVLPSFGVMSPAMTELERLTRAHEIAHGGNRYLGWQIGNVQARVNADGDLKIDVEKSSGPVSGPIALVVALGQAMAGEAEPMVAFGS